MSAVRKCQTLNLRLHFNKTLRSADQRQSHFAAGNTVRKLLKLPSARRHPSFLPQRRVISPTNFATF
ncbi:MAG: hypothetical protein ACTS6G_03130 [Candidatus Hodgkinia cicadicola]